jgi:hypothetical protein
MPVPENAPIAALEPPAAAQPVVAKTAKRRSSLAYGALWGLGIGSGAVAAGAFVGFLVNGPPQRPSAPRAASTEIAAATPPAEASTAATTPAAVETPTPPTATETREAEATSPSSGTPVPPPVAETADVKAIPLIAAEVREVQGKLRALGFDPGPVDGDIGPRTANAARLYQRARGLGENGTIDRDLLARLRRENARTATPSPPPQRRVYPTSTAAAPAPPPPRQRSQFLDDLDRLFHR